jgi:hypothetical protein
VSLNPEFLGAEGRVDVTRVMEHLRKGLPSVSSEDLTVRAQKRLLALAEEAEVDPEFLSRILGPEGGWNLLPDYRIETHRRGIGRGLVVFLKGLVRPFVRLYTDPLLRRQAEINGYLVKIVGVLAREVVRLEAESRKPRS